MNIYGYEITINNPPYVFGDGTHETTRFLLYFLNRYAEGRSYIDAGCGTGILSIFASKRGATSVTAIDADAHAIECTRANIEANGVEVDVIQQEIQKLKPISADLVTANIARIDALFILPYLTKFVSDNGLLLITWYKQNPKEALSEDFEIIDCIEGIDYDCYVLRKR